MRSHSEVPGVRTSTCELGWELDAVYRNRWIGTLPFFSLPTHLPSVGLCDPLLGELKLFPMTSCLLFLNSSLLCIWFIKFIFSRIPNHDSWLQIIHGPLPEEVVPELSDLAESSGKLKEIQAFGLDSLTFWFIRSSIFFKDLQIILVIRTTDLEKRIKFPTIWSKFTLQLHNPLESSVYLPGSKTADASARIYLHVGPPEDVLSHDLLLQASLVLLKSRLFFDVSLQLSYCYHPFLDLLYILICATC